MTMHRAIYIRTGTRKNFGYCEDHYDKNDDIYCLIRSPEVLVGADFKFANAKIATIVYGYLGWFHPYFSLSANHYCRFISTLDAKQQLVRLLKIPVFSANGRDIDGYDYVQLQKSNGACSKLYGHKLYKE